MAKQLKERVKIGTDDAGKPIYKWATGYTKQDLFLSIAALLSAPQEKEAAPLFGEFLIQYVQTYKNKQSDLTRINRDQLMKKHILPRLGELPIDEITTPVLQKWFDELCDVGYARETIHKIKHIISPAFDSAVEDGIIQRTLQSQRDCSSIQRRVLITKRFRQNSCSMFAVTSTCCQSENAACWRFCAIQDCALKKSSVFNGKILTLKPEKSKSSVQLFIRQETSRL